MKGCFVIKETRHRIQKNKLVSLIDVVMEIPYFFLWEVHHEIFCVDGSQCREIDAVNQMIDLMVDTNQINVIFFMCHMKIPAVAHTLSLVMVRISLDNKILNMNIKKTDIRRVFSEKVVC
jgi:hypothetical protein